MTVPGMQVLVSAFQIHILQVHVQPLKEPKPIVNNWKQVVLIQ